jgi:hypothetical protein
MVGVVVTTIVLEELRTHIKHVGADAIEEIHGVGDKNQGAIPLLEVLFEPHASLEIQVSGGVVKEQQ